MLINYDYADRSRTEGAGSVNALLVRVTSPTLVGRVASTIDATFANSAHHTKTYSFRQLALASVERIGDVGLAVRLISGAVFFALLFSVGAVMIQSGRERTVEFGVLKALGYGDGAIVALTLAESLILCLVAGAIGLAISTFVYPIAVRTIHFNLKAGPAIAVGLAYAAALALIAGSLPAWRAGRLAVVDALAGR
jgi:putative ABC transport system permease protein